MRHACTCMRRGVHCVTFRGKLTKRQPSQPTRILHGHCNSYGKVTLLLHALLGTRKFSTQVTCVNASSVTDSPSRMPALTTVGRTFYLLFRRKGECYLSTACQCLPPRSVPRNVRNQGTLMRGKSDYLVLALPRRSTSTSASDLGCRCHLVASDGPPALGNATAHMDANRCGRCLLDLCRSAPGRGRASLLGGRVGGATTMRSTSKRCYLRTSPRRSFFRRPVSAAHHGRSCLLP